MAIALSTAAFVAACAQREGGVEEATKRAAPEVAPLISLGDGEANWIVTDGVNRPGKTFMFKEVHIERNGWLVLHPFATP